MQHARLAASKQRTHRCFLFLLMSWLQPLPEPSPGYAKSVNGQSSSSSMLSASPSNHSTNYNPPNSPIHASYGLNPARSPGYSTDSGFHSIPSSPHSPADTRGRSNTETGEVRAVNGYPSPPYGLLESFTALQRERT